MDEEENWVERNLVLSKADHLQLVANAKSIVEELVANLPISSSPVKLTSEGNYVQDSEYSYMKEFTDEDFTYSVAQFDVDYFEGISSESNSDPSDLARKSLFVKFDPLVGKPSSKGRGAPKKVQMVPMSPGDLLGTPPSHIASDNVQGNLLGTPTVSASVSSNTIMQSNILSPLGTSIADSHQPVALPVPETDNLIDVLKYSEDDVPELLDAVRKDQREMEAKKHDSCIQALRQKIVTARQQLQQNNRKKESFQAKTVLQSTSCEKAEQDLTKCRGKIKSHIERETDLLAKHQEFKKDFTDLEEQLELVKRDSTSLENAFDELHQLYVKQKAVHQCLSDRNKIIQQYISELKSWTHEDMASKEEIHQALEALEQKVEETFETMQKENTSRMTIERTKALKLKLQLENLDSTYKQKEEEKQQVSQICDELMRELENMQKIG